MQDLIKQLRGIVSLGSKRPGELMAEAADELARLTEIEAAARNLVAQKGRHNTEIAYKKLEGLLK